RTARCSSTTSSPWITARCARATRPCWPAPRTTASASRSWTRCSWSWRRCSPPPAAASACWRPRRRWGDGPEVPVSPLSVSLHNSPPRGRFLFFQILTDWQDKKGDRRFLKLSKEHDVGPSVKHGKPKKQKLEGKGGHGTGPGPGRPKSKNLQPKIPEYEFQDDPIEVPRIPKNDAPNRFWASVEPYCADLTNEEVRVLEELLKPPEDEAEHYKIPPLGKHYSQRWAQEDLLEEQKDGARAAAAADKKKGVLGPLTELDTKDVDALLKKSEAQHEQPEDGCPFGPLTQRLLQALVEENIISPVEDSPIPEIAGKDSGADGAGTSPRSQNKPFSVPHTKSLEGRIKEELVAQGLLESEDRPAEDSEDEVLAELRKRQAELKALSAHNRAKKHELLRLAKEELHRQELRQRVRMADNEVMDAFRKIMAARQKKRTPT
uniref:Transcriptional adaptor 3 n=1 Tax=Anas platyrhynchos platyrhynchos TaxID=8840 RepID=A0A493T9K4_ANAPP